MPRMRKVVLTIELDTCLTIRELREIHHVAFGIDIDKRRTVQQVVPEGIDHDCRGTIEQVQANVVKP